MNRVPDEYEIVDEPQPWALRYPGITMAVVGGMVSIGVIAFGTWLDNRQRPQLEEIRTAIVELRQENRQENRHLATLQLETSRWFGDALSGISESANVKMPPRPKALDRAEDHVRSIQERVN